MRVSSQLLGAVVGVTMLALLVYGVLAYWLTQNADVQKRLELLNHFGAEIADRLAEAAEAPDPRLLERLRKQLAPSHTILLWKAGAHAPVVAAEPGSGEPLLRAIVARHGATPLPATTQAGHENYPGGDYLWVQTPLPDRPQAALLILEPYGESPIASTLRSRLIVSGIAILWIAVWVALFLSSRISRRLEEKNQALRHQALHDELTGLPNRNLLLDRLRQARSAAQRHGLPFALFLMDLNRFKEVNDTLGHHFGDRLLQEVGERLGASLRENDSIARLGGDEFAMLLPETDRHGATVCASRIHQVLQQPFDIEGVRIEAGASIGIALYPEHGEDPATLLQHADVAMYQAKRSGGFAFYDPGQDSHSVRRLRLMGELRSAIEQGQLFLHYQPMLDLRRGAPAALEVLTRWQHPALGRVAPDEFIPMAEQTGTIHALTVWSLQQALREDPAPDLILSLNLSPQCLQDTALPDAIGALLAEHDFPATRLQLEITENALMHDLQRARQLLNRLHGMGIRLAIDDFGTGFSSLAYLRELPFDELKIDKSFVMDMAEENNLAIVRTIIDLGHNLHYQVVAEGVEEPLGLERLRALGCDRVQGYLFSRPQPADALRDWLREGAWRQVGRAASGRA